MIFPSIAENLENMMFTLSVFAKMLFFMQCMTVMKLRILTIKKYLALIVIV